MFKIEPSFAEGSPRDVGTLYNDPDSLAASPIVKVSPSFTSESIRVIISRALFIKSNASLLIGDGIGFIVSPLFLWLVQPFHESHPKTLDECHYLSIHLGS